MTSTSPAASGAAAKPARLMLLMLRDQLAVSLPVLLMALLAAGTWWLVRNSPRIEGARAALAKQHEVDYSMGPFTTERFGTNGALRAIIQGQALRHFADTDTVEVEQMHASGTDDSGRHFYAAALHSVSDGGAVNVQLSGQVSVVREALLPAAQMAGTNMTEQPARHTQAQANGRLELSAETLVLDTGAEHAHSDRPVTLVSDAGRVHALALDYDGIKGQTLLSGRVQGVYAAVPMQSASQAVPAAVR